MISDYTVPYTTYRTVRYRSMSSKLLACNPHSLTPSWSFSSLADRTAIKKETRGNIGPSATKPQQSSIHELLCVASRFLDLDLPTSTGDHDNDGRRWERRSEGFPLAYDASSSDWLHRIVGVDMLSTEQYNKDMREDAPGQSTNVLSSNFMYIYAHDVHSVHPIANSNVVSSEVGSCVTVFHSTSLCKLHLNSCFAASSPQDMQLECCSVPHQALP